MTGETVIGLVNNAALLLAMGLIYDILGDRPHIQKTRFQQTGAGVALGAVGIAIMLSPWQFMPGIVFDTRSVLLGISGVFFGTLPTLLAMAVTGAYRLYQGGAGVWTGIGVIVTSGSIGLAWRHIRRNREMDLSIRELYSLGIVVHLAMLAWMLALPFSVAKQVLADIWLPVMLIFPVTTALLGWLMRNRVSRKRAEEALRQSEARLKTAMDDSRRHQTLLTKMIANIGDVIAIVDQHGINRYKSANVERLFGWTPEELVGKSTWDIIHPDDVPPLQEFFSQFLERPDAVETTECRYQCKDGQYRWIEFTGTNLFHDPDINGLLGNYHDITQRKQAELLLRESEARFKALHNASFGGIAIHDQGAILECNQGLSDMTGYTVDELIGMDGLLLIAPSFRPQVMEHIRSGYEKPYESMGLRKNNESYPVRLEARNIPYKGKQVRTVEFRDITERKKAEAEYETLVAQLNQARKMESIGRLAGGVAHDFNNMLGVILGHAEMALDQVADDTSLRSDLTEIQLAAQRSADLTRQLLTFARKQIIDPKVLDLNQTIKPMMVMLQRLIGENIQLVWEPAEDLWPVKMDPSQIDQILANLCVNARDAITDVGSMVIETGMKTFDAGYCSQHAGFVPGDFVLLTVSDNGCGMDRQTLDNLFEPFFTTKDTGKGTGLGLATVYGIVRQNNGFVNVYSEPGRGTTFNIYLPRHTPDTDEIPVPLSPPATAPSGHETILVVEDEPGILKMTRKILEKKGYTVLGAGTPTKALTLARECRTPIHLVLTDVVMPEMNGRDLAEKLLEFHPDMKLMFMSGYTANVIAHQGVLDKGVCFIQKPFSMTDLAITVRRLLDEPPADPA